MVKTLICEGKEIKNVILADTFIKRLMGYMFRSKPHCSAIVFSPCNSIHTYFMKFDIDVLFLDDEMKIIKRIEGLSRGSVIKPVTGAKMVIEGEAGLFSGFKTGSEVIIY